MTKPLVASAGTEGSSRDLRLSGCCRTDALAAEINFCSSWHADGWAHAAAWLARLYALENPPRSLLAVNEFIKGKKISLTE